MKQIIKNIELINTQENHYKIWICTLFDDGSILTKWGRADAEILQSKEFENEGEKGFEKRVNSKIRKGYSEETP